ncbi:hypothetical protein IWZ00DRAFT_506574 [Phyllosticta capitalensis]|uniref:uncharacterized protein n=1 Tax=Phyllosticta capitalensis TaxID=121624 RepID=UPI00312FF1AF
MAFTKFKTKDLARSASLKKSRRRRIVFLSTSHPKSFDHRPRRPSTKNKSSLSAMAESKSSPKMVSKTASISSALESQPKSKTLSSKSHKKTRPEINLIKNEREASSETSESSNSSTKPSSIFDHDEGNGKPGPVDTPPSSPASETAPVSEKEKQESETAVAVAAADAKRKKRPVEQAKSEQPQKSTKPDSAKPQVSTSRKNSEKPAKTAENPRQKKKMEMADFQVSRDQFIARLDRRWPNPAIGGKGLVNPHIFCYRRSVLQCLLNIPLFVSWLNKHHMAGSNQCPGRYEESTQGKTHPKNAPACLACALIRLARAYWRPESQQALLAATKNFDQAMAKIALKTTRFPAVGSNWGEVFGEQQDAAEFFLWILQALEEHGQMNRGEIDTIFRHRIRKEKCCPECDHRSPREDASKTFLLAVNENRDSLESMIAESMRIERLQQVSCDNDHCKYSDKSKRRLNMSRKTTGILECPEILVVQIQRAGYTKGGPFKKTNVVTYPPILDLTSRLDPQSDETTAKYSLSGVVRHRGGNLNTGHYIADSITPKGVRLFDDSEVKRRKLSDLLVPREGGTGQYSLTPYLLFYTRLRDDEQSPLSQLDESNNAPGNTNETLKKTPKNGTPKSKDGKSTSSTGKSSAATPGRQTMQKKRKLSDATQSSPKKQKKSKH